MSITARRAAAENPGSLGASPVSSSRAIRPGSGLVSSIQPRNCQIALKSSVLLITGVPVSAISSGSLRRSRSAAASDSTSFERCDEWFLMKCASSTTIPLNPSVLSQPECRSSTS